MTMIGRASHIYIHETASSLAIGVGMGFRDRLVDEYGFCKFVETGHILEQETLWLQTTCSEFECWENSLVIMSV